MVNKTFNFEQFFTFSALRFKHLTKKMKLLAEK